MLQQVHGQLTRLISSARSGRLSTARSKINPTAAMESTSVGLGQIMGFHWKRLGYGSVGEMWDHAKTGVEGQLDQIIKFLTSDSRLRASIERKDWHTVASIYNGAWLQSFSQEK